MSKILKSNKILREFTFVLVTITIVGILVCFIVKDEYTIFYQLWFKRMYKKVKKLYDELDDDQKKELYKLATQGKIYSKDVVVDILSKQKFLKDHVKLIVSLGSKVIEKTLTTIDKKLDDGKKN